MSGEINVGRPEDLDTPCQEDGHFFTGPDLPIDDLLTAIPAEDRCHCGQFTWGEMNEKLRLRDG